MEGLRRRHPGAVALAVTAVAVVAVAACAPVPGPTTTTSTTLPEPVELTADSVAAGPAHTCAVVTGSNDPELDGAVACWGTNDDGRLGRADVLPVTAGRPVPGVVRFDGEVVRAVSVAAGEAHTCIAPGTEGPLRCWGRSESGQAGVDGTPPPGTPVVLAELDDVVEVVAGRAHSCARSVSGLVRCWGSNRFGQLGGLVGLGTDGSVPTPARVLLGTDPQSGFVYLEDAVALAAGSDHTCAVRSGGSVWCWGSNSTGQLGTTADPAAPALPAAVPGVVDAVALTAGSGHTCGLLGDGTLRCWGDNRQGQVGVSPRGGVGGPLIRPVSVVAGVEGGLSVAAGSTHTCVSAVDGTVRCWGSTALGQLGVPSLTTGAPDADGWLGSVSPVPPLVDGQPLDGTGRVGSGPNHTCAVAFDRRVRCWGLNDGGAAGRAADLEPLVLSPTLVPPGL